MSYIGMIALVTFAQLIGAYFALKMLEKKVYSLNNVERMSRFARLMNITADHRYLVLNKKSLISQLEIMIEGAGKALTPGVILYLLGAVIAVSFALQAIVTQTGLPYIGNTTRGTSILLSGAGMVVMVYSTKFLFRPWYQYAMAKVMIPFLKQLK